MIMEKMYESPEITTIEVMVEKGFAASYDDVEIGGTGTPD
jgi:hypothetical protein